MHKVIFSMLVSGLLVLGTNGQTVLLGGFDNNEGILSQDSSVAEHVGVTMSGYNAGRDYEGDPAGLWGSLNLEPDASTANYAVNQAFGDLPDFTITVENTSLSKSVDLSQLHWVSKREHYKAESAYTISASGDIASSGTVSNSLGVGDNIWRAFDIDLTPLLLTNTLAPGELVTLSLVWTGQTGSRSFMVDNLAISGALSSETVTPQQTVIVKWGASSGDTGIVTDIQQRTDAFDLTYDPVKIISPDQGPSYYPNPVGKSPFFYGANSINNREVDVKDSGTGDYIELTPAIDSGDTYSAMVIWQDFLTNCTWIDTVSIDIEKRYWDTDSSYRLLVQKESGEWYAGPARSLGSSMEEAGLLPWYAFTPFVDGTATVASVRSAIDLTNITAVGFYMESQNTSDSSHIVGGGLVYFQVTSTTNALLDAERGLDSFDTGHTVIKVCSGMLNGESVIVGASYEGAVLAMDYDGILLWTNPLSGYMVRDLWCDDLNGDGTDEILTAGADGSVHCLNLSDGSSFWSAPFQPNDVPMNAVCTIRGSGGSKYIACGGFDKNFYWLNADGTLHSAVDSSTYSTLKPWGTAAYYLDRYIGYAHTPNFLRPVPQADGTDHLMMLGYMHMQFRGKFYEFEPLSASPTIPSISPNTQDAIGALEISDPDGDGNFSIFMGGNSFSIVVEELDLGSGTNYYHSESFTDPFKTYRFSALTDIPDGNSYKHFALCGNKIVLFSPHLAVREESILMPHAFHHMWNDHDKNRIVLSSCQSGGSGIHVIDTSKPYWKQEVQDLYSPGKMESMQDNYNTIRDQVGNFVRPAWEREPDQVIEIGSGEHPVAVALREKYGVANPLFVGFAHTTNVQTQEWKNAAAPSSVLPLVDPADEPYLHKFDNGITYGRTQQQLLDQHFQPAIDSFTYGLSFRAGHGNDPYYYQPETLLEVIDRSYAKDPNRKTVLSWAEVQSTDSNMKYPLGRLFMPVAERLKTHNGIMSFNNKHMFWSSTVHKAAWSDFISGKVKEVFRPCMEESTSKTAELSLSGRIGLWASGCFDSWGMRTTRDNTSFDRTREIAAQIVPNHFLRHMVYRLAYGARFSHSSYTDADYQSLIWELVASGALYIPRREEIVSFSPVHISITDPDERYIAGNEIPKWTTYYDEAEQAANPMVFGRLEACWKGGKNTDWDFSRYAAGVKDRRQNFIPPFPNGMVLNTPVESGMYASPADYRNRLVDNLHPMYKYILKEHITDGKYYIERDGLVQHAANGAYFETVTNDLRQGAEMLPVTVSGDVAWVCAQTATNHLRLTLIDSGYLNPKDRTATVTFNTVTPFALTDVLKGETLPISGESVEIDVPLGMFRFIDIELSQPFYPAAPTWTEFVAGHQLDGNPDSDFDQDGLTDFVEFGIGGNPRTADRAEIMPWLEVTSTNGPARFSYWGFDSTASGVVYDPQWTEDLVSGPWQTNWSALSIIPNSTSAYSRFEYNLDSAGKTNVFFKLDLIQDNLEEQ
ncbi:PQQ-binding-like beta-propeller repeat protein [Pontiella sulfatireligans]|uniref:Lambda-carrageenase n=1 Tax=Pontiella sulfatireligans TaxID=2750658 RepID=A0A6C2UH93_9BACT|nr:hypothetical protein [Pontiella sulfatireligans]VGO18877.1 Lambda-carrageenase [Pontiella sulfatireligans]